ncbi:MAG: glycosyltransferase WbuB [Chloroflexi bacterium RBG_16_52_11]|nr:MAG: glycosyltransferase WbuB [Chloroflexi bacterium RBG_16_52_11]
MAARILICRSNPVAPDPRVEKTARALFSRGYRVQIVGWDRTGKLPEADRLSGAIEEIVLFRLPIEGKFGHGVGNLPNLLRWQWGLLSWLMRRRNEYDIIHACDFDTVLPALFCKRLWGKTVVYDVFDFYADHLRSTPGWIKSMIRWIDLQALHRVDAILLADESRTAQIAAAAPRKVEVIYNTPQDVLGQVTPSTRPPSSRLHLAYIGLLQVERGLMEMLAVLERHPEWTLDLAGFGGDEADIQSAAAGLPNVTWHGRVSYERAIQLSAAADVLFATYDPAIPNHRYASPNKLFEAMMLGKPILVCEDTNIDRLVAAADCGVVIPYGKIPALESALTHLATDAGYCDQLGKNARRAYEGTYSWAKMEARLLDFYAALSVQPA